MKNIVLGIIVPAFAGLLSVSCEKTQVYVEVQAVVPTLTVSSGVTAFGAGGTYSFACSVTDPAEDGTLRCAADASWISGFDVSASGVVSFTVDENLTEELRTGNITVTYNYTDAGIAGHVVGMVGVVQYGTAAPVLTVATKSISAAADGGVCSFDYTLANGVADGTLSCAADANWISGFDCSREGTVSFDVEANDGLELRTATVTLTYAYGYERLVGEVMVVQDYPDIVIVLDQLVGTYAAHGYAYDSSLGPTEQDWELKIFPNDSSTVIVDGLTPRYAGMYPALRYYIAKAHLNAAGQIVIPSQFTGIQMAEHSFPYYMGFQVCTLLDESGWHRITTNSQPDCLLTYDPFTETWTGDYGMFIAKYYTDGHFSSWMGFTDAVAPGFTIRKVSDSTD